MSQVMPTLIHGAYLASTVLLILGLHNLRSPASAIGGNRLAALGMLVAVLATVFNSAILNLELILLGLIVGALIGSLAARFVQMTAMPQLVGLFNGFGGGASALVAIGEYGRLISTSAAPDLYTMLTILLGMFIGAVTLSGSLVAFGKLQGLVAGAPIMFRFQHVTHGLLMLVFLAGAGLVVQAPDTWGLFLALIGLAFVLGALFVLPDWLRRYARGDLTSQRLLGPCRECHRIHRAKPALDRCWRLGWRLWGDFDPDDVYLDEPVARSCPIRHIWDERAYG